MHKLPLFTTDQQHLATFAHYKYQPDKTSHWVQSISRIQATCNIASGIKCNVHNINHLRMETKQQYTSFDTKTCKKSADARPCKAGTPLTWFFDPRLLLGTEAPIVTPNGTDCCFLFFSTDTLSDYRHTWMPWLMTSNRDWAGKRGPCCPGFGDLCWLNSRSASCSPNTASTPDTR